MTETEFRYYHSELIAYYQYIEMHLEGICAALLADEEKDWFLGLKDYESDTIGMLINKLKQIKKDQKTDYISEDEFAQLDAVKERRNYWCHQCFVGVTPIIFTRGKTPDDKKVRCPDYEDKIKKDLQTAIEWDEKLSVIFSAIKEDRKITFS